MTEIEKGTVKSHIDKGLPGMKGVIVAIVAVGILLTLVVTNPSSDDYAAYLREEIAKEAEAEGEMAEVLMMLFGGVAESILGSATSRDNYVLFNIYTTDLGDGEFIVLGVLGNFVLLNEDSNLHEN